MKTFKLFFCVFKPRRQQEMRIAEITARDEWPLQFGKWFFMLFNFPIFNRVFPRARTFNVLSRKCSINIFGTGRKLNKLSSSEHVKHMQFQSAFIFGRVWWAMIGKELILIYVCDVRRSFGKWIFIRTISGKEDLTCEMQRMRANTSNSRFFHV